MKTKFFEAILKSDLDSISSLLEKYADLANARDENGYTPLMWAAHNGEINVFKLLVERNADIHATVAQVGTAVIHFAAEGGNLDILEYLISAGVNIKQVNNENYSCLHFAAGNGQQLMLAKLLELGLDIHLRTFDTSDSPLHAAAKCNQLDTVSYLLQSGANINSVNNDELGNKKGATIFDIAVYHWNSELIKLILNFQNKNPNDFIYSRILSDIFNNEKLCLLLESDGYSYTNGGSHYEAIDVIIKFLNDFILQFSHEQLKCIVTNLISLKNKNCDNDKIANLSEDNPIYFNTGYQGHILYGSVIMHSNMYSISLCERGFFSQTANKGKVYPIFYLTTSNGDIVNGALDRFHEAKEQKKEIASITLMDDIPKMFQRPYQVDERIEQKPFERGRCYFENLKSLVLSEMIRIVGLIKGKTIYKEFILFMHETAINHFSTYATRSNKMEILELCTSNLNKKLQKCRPKNDIEFNKTKPGNN